MIKATGWDKLNAGEVHVSDALLVINFSNLK
jgi:hypothetical protein